MQKIYPQNTTGIKAENEPKGPKQKTIDFLKQFARTYTYCQTANTDLGGLIAN